jgi:hypothetical protein
MANKKTLKPNEAECNICGQRMPASDEMMYVHIVTRHPLELLAHPKFQRSAATLAFQLGARVAEMFRR